ncbi:MAG: hypothetical protein NZ888_06575 [Candidatus Nitrosocaldus sp.]|nr:hypothetical protein [Candidatus Nitrosocaldus sp.]MDW8000537.1 hypothetical protein [Candidatus Nitrosocaldus sp.]
MGNSDSAGKGNGMISRAQLLISLSALLILMHAMDAYATHTSVPVIEPLERYIAGKAYDLRGVMLYNGQPTSDILVEVRIDTPYGSYTEYARSAGDGRFTIGFKPMAQGYYTITATSHCRDVHRNICTYQSTMLEVAVYEEASVDRLCLVGGECISIYPLTVMSIDSRLSGEPITVDGSNRSLTMMFVDVGDRAGAILALPREVIDSPGRLAVMVDGVVVEHREHQDSAGARILEFPLRDGGDDGSAVVEISGTYVIPEFPLTIVSVFASSLLASLAIRRFIVGVEH